jgi:hypothetical protein
VSALRLYDVETCGRDGYPPEWHETIKHAVREAAGNRCVRCLHPYAKGAGEWSPCDVHCAHGGEVRGPDATGEWSSYQTDAFTVNHRTMKEIPVEARWRILTVHHLDGNKVNCRWWNLAALCQRCHLQIQGKVRMERVWPWEHSAWFRPYVAGYYAWVYLGEDISREEAVARMGELLALERAA